MQLNYILSMVSGITLLIALNRQSQHNNAAVNFKSMLSSYDYIIIGAGSAGSVVASRLSEDHNINVLLLEAGGPQNLYTDMPPISNGVRQILGNSNWQYKIESQKHSAWLYESNSFTWDAGKVFGGTSTINTLIYNRGNKNDYNIWNSNGWRFDDVLPYFLKSENNTDENIVRNNHKYHNKGGLLSVSSQIPEPYFKYLIGAANKAGYPTVDFNGPNNYGISNLQLTEVNGIRQSTASAFIENNNAWKRKNLHILCYAFVTKILFDKQNKVPKADQVEFLFNNTYYKVKAKKEIILSAGTIRSPQILMLSGIGPKQELRKLNIPVIVDAPAVGQNLYDHPVVPLHVYINQSLFEPFPYLTTRNLNDYFLHHNGPLARFRHLYCYSSTPINNKILNNKGYLWPDVLFSFRTSNYDFSLEAILKSFKDKKQWMNYLKPYLGKKLILGALVTTKIKSKGSIKLNSTNPFTQPIIDPNYYSNELDLIRTVQGAKQMFKIFNRKTIGHEFEYIFLEKPIPGCSSCQHGIELGQCDQYIECLIRSLSNTAYHYIGTNKMKSNNDKYDDWVVDEELKVKQVTGLRVIDASIMPKLITGNTNAPSIMIGEKGAQIIKNQYLHYSN